MSKVKFQLPKDDDEDLIGVGSDLSNKDEDDSEHYKLLSEISKLGGKKRTFVPERTEALRSISEYSLSATKSADDEGDMSVVNVDDLLQSLSKKRKVTDLKKKLEKAEKRSKTLNAPLEKPQAQHVQRVTAYQKVTEEVAKWDPVVKKNRRAEQLVFPLNQKPVKIQTAEESAATFVPKTPLERQIAELLHGSKHIQKKGEELTEAEKEALSSMSLKEALERRKELSRMRALQSYQEAKARRQNKIKSKKYHRLLKRERMRKEMQEFEALQRTDPEAALEKLEQLEKVRVEERMTLRHKGTGKWAKLQAIRSKYDTEAREALADQLRLGKELTHKAKKTDDSDDDNFNDMAETDQQPAQDNPWLSSSTSQGDGGTSGYRKYWNDKNQQIAKKKETENEDKDENDDENEEEEEGDDEDDTKGVSDVEDFDPDHSAPLQEGLERRTQLHDFDDLADEEEPRESANQQQEQQDQSGSSSKKKKNKQKKPEKEQTQGKQKEISIDPENFIAVKNTVVNSSVPELMAGNEEDEDEEDADARTRRMTLAEAFADDDVIEEFRQEKQDLVDRSKPKDIDLTLPGWGEWGGTGLKISRRKRRRFIIKAPPAEKRRDENTGNLILNEDKNPHMRKQQVSELPFPFTSVAAFETAIRAPVTQTFVPETAVRKLAAPKIVTKAGVAISPMDESVLAKVKAREAETSANNAKEDRKKFYGKNKVNTKPQGQKFERKGRLQKGKK